MISLKIHELLFCLGSLPEKRFYITNIIVTYHNEKHKHALSAVPTR